VKTSFSAVDIVCTIDTDTLMAGKKIVNLFSCKHVHDAHEWFTEVPELKGKWFKRLIWSWVEKKCLKNIDLGYTVVERIGKHYGKLANKEFHLIHNYPQAKEVIMFEKEYDIIYQGAVNKGRCVQELISIAVKNNYKVCICGDGDEFEEIKKMSKGHKNIYLKGMVAPSKLHEFTCKSKIGYNFFEVLSKSYDESMSNKTFDYMQARIPQIISYSKAIDGLNKIKPFALAVNKEGLDAGIKQLLQSEQLYNKLQQNIDELRLKYIWEKEELKLIQLYAEIE
jgi:hypothetical protein